MMTLRTSSFALSLSALVSFVACSGGDGGDGNSVASGGAGGGANVGVGGTSPTGGAVGAGGTVNTGGAASGGVGGMPGVGGSTGGAPGSVGGTGGVTGMGGSTGGAAGDGGSGGVPAAGGDAGTGGDDGSGGGSGDPEFHIYLAVGQSNMQGAAHVPDSPPYHERVQVLQSETCPSSDGHDFGYGEWREMFTPIVMCFEGTRALPGGGGEVPIGLGPTDSFAVAMAEASGPNVTIGIMGAAHGDTSISQHLPGCTSGCLPSWGNNINGAPVINGTTPLFEWVVDLAKKAQEMGEIKGIIFHQGENDSGDASWPGKVNEYVTALRAELGLNAADVPFIAGELPHTGGSAAGHNPLVQKIPDVVENGHYVSGGPMEDGTVLGDRGDGIHWSTDSVIEMGKRYADKMLEAQGKK